MQHWLLQNGSQRLCSSKKKVGFCWLHKFHGWVPAYCFWINAVPKGKRGQTLGAIVWYILGSQSALLGHQAPLAWRAHNKAHLPSVCAMLGKSQEWVGEWDSPQSHSSWPDLDSSAEHWTWGGGNISLQQYKATAAVNKTVSILKLKVWGNKRSLSVTGRTAKQATGMLLWRACGRNYFWMLPCVKHSPQVEI